MLQVELWKHNGFVCEYHVLNEDGNFIGTIKTSRHPAKYVSVPRDSFFPCRALWV